MAVVIACIVSIPKRVSEALNLHFNRCLNLPYQVSIPKRVSEALNPTIADRRVRGTYVSIPKRVSEALNPQNTASSR